MKQEDWTKQLRDKLADYEEPVPEGLWERIEARLPQQSEVPVKPVRTVPMWARWAAAAVLVGIVAGTGMLIWHHEQEPLTAASESSVPRQQEHTIPGQTEEATPQKMLAATVEKSAISSQGKTGASASADVAEASAMQTDSTALTIQDQTVPEPMKPQISEKTSEDIVRELDRKIAQTKKDRKTAKVGFSLYASNGFGNQSSTNGVLMSQQMLENYNYGKYMSASTRSGSPVYLTNHEEKHKYYQPISFGLTANIPISSAISLSSGVVYTRLASDFTSIANSLVYKKEQTLHYIGIPLNLQYRIYQWRGLNVYATAGGQADINVKADMETDGLKMDTEKDRVQWSLGGALGIQYNIIPQIGIYAEPGVKHYFDNGSRVNTFFKDKPTNFNLQVGLRLNL